ncbi:hypothetical protein ASD18_10510 [Cellulomonas sp. Root137]|nr:hypothetical protein ASD18_10510 [Cellulomonas sp. Root137]
MRVGEHELAVLSSDGDTDAPAFVLVHGLGMSHRYLERLGRELRRTGTTHCVDLPGFGGRPKPDGPLTIEEGAALIGGALDAMGLDRVTLVGHSMGAQFATELAAQRPDLVTHLVLIGPVTDPARARPLSQARDLVRDAVKEPPSGNAMALLDYLRCGPRWYLTELAPMLAYRTDQALRRVIAPTLVIRGEDDPVARRPWCAQLASAAVAGTLVEIPRHRHLVQHTAAGMTAAAIAGLAR